MTPLILHMIFTSSVLVLGMMVVLWLYAVVKRNAGIVDVGWGMGFLAVAAVCYFMGSAPDFRKDTLFLLISLWSLRLTGYLFRRFLQTDEDKRYQRLRDHWKEHIDLKFLALFLLQGGLILCITLPFYIIATAQGPWNLSETAGLVVFLIGLVGETAADRQLSRFKKERKNKGCVCEKGLWRYSRHPNYFFEWVVWIGVALLAASHPYGVLSLIAPLIMGILLRFISGVPLAERELLETRRDAYEKYQRRVNCFIPWFRG